MFFCVKPVKDPDSESPRGRVGGGRERGVATGVERDVRHEEPVDLALEETIEVPREQVLLVATRDVDRRLRLQTHLLAEDPTRVAQRYLVVPVLQQVTRTVDAPGVPRGSLGTSGVRAESPRDHLR